MAGTQMKETAARVMLDRAGEAAGLSGYFALPENGETAGGEHGAFLSGSVPVAMEQSRGRTERGGLYSRCT